MITRVISFSICCILITMLSPFIIMIFVFSIITGRKIFFCQERVGLNGEIFILYKIKTMNDLKDKNGKYLPDEKRLGKTGKLIRSLSIDELPSLWNVLKGDMSLVGPRPLLVEYLPLYSKMQARRHDVLPGITGWAQVNGRNAISWDEKFELDVWYVDNKNIWLDIKILFLTVKKVLIREGISSTESVTMEKFRG